MSTTNEMRPFQVPCGIEAACKRLESAVKADGLRSAIVHVADGKLVSASLFDKDDRQHYLMHRDGQWYEWVEV